MRRLLLLLVAVAALVGALTGCADSPSGGTASPSPSPVATADPAPTGESSSIDLVGLWRVSGAEGEQADTWLRLGGGDVVLWRACGILSGSWAADDRAFLAVIDGASDACAPHGTEFWKVPWLLSATGYQRDGDAWRLTDRNGDVVAVLRRDGAPRPIGTADPSFAQPPRVDDQVRAALRVPSLLPRRLTPVDAASLVGTWTPATGLFSTDPHVSFMADGTSESSDGCNGMSGRWSVSEPGRLLSLGGGSTDIGCDGAQVPAWVAGAARAGFDGDELVLLDVDGGELGRLLRA